MHPPLANPIETIQKSGITAKKAYGQHFLHDAQVLERIVTFANISKETSIIEIGPGPGTLTQALLASPAKHITAIELDTRCIPHLESLAKHEDNRLNITQADAMEVDITTLFSSAPTIVANLPYNVGTALLLKWLRQIYEQPSCIEQMTLMFQKEVGQRICAKPGGKDYGRLSILSQWLCEVNYGFDVLPSSFTPPPKVDSAVIQLTPRSKLLFDVSWDMLETFLSAAFGQRRKMLRASLKHHYPQTIAWLENAEIDPTRRPETLTLEEIARLLGLLALLKPH